MTTSPPSSDQGLRVRVLLSVQRALVSEVSRAVRHIGVSWNAQEIRIRWVFDGEISEEDLESASVVETEINADMPDHEIVTETLRHDAPGPLADVRHGYSVFGRRES